MDGVVMGGGAGISLPGMFRVVTDKTVRKCSLNISPDQIALCFYNSLELLLVSGQSR